MSNTKAADERRRVEGPDTRVFRVFAWVILVFVIVAFVGKAVFDTKDLPPITLLHHFHAVSMGAWFVLFALQATLMERGNIRLHRLLGRTSPLLVISFLVFAAIISRQNWLRVGEPLIITSNLVNCLLFLGFYVTAILKRRDGDTHMRLMTFATLSLIGPAAGRIPETLDINVFFALPITLSFIFAPLVYDRFFLRQVRRVSILGTILLFAAIPVVVALSGSAGWLSFLEAMIGPQAPLR